MRWREQDGIRWLEASLPGAAVAFTARVGGASAAPYDSLNLGVLTGDEESAVRGNRARLAEALGLDVERIVIGRQVHEAAIAGHDGPQDPAPYAVAGTDPPTVDGHWTMTDDLALLVFVADCLPIALAGAGGGVAMLHGGWRPLAAGIVDKGVDAVAQGGSLHAAIGPGIGPCCFEVGEDVVAAFAGLGPGLGVPSGNDGRVLLDLPEVACRLLERRGVTIAERSDLCTRCNPDLFFSHRGQGPETGRQAGLVWRAG